VYQLGALPQQPAYSSLVYCEVAGLQPVVQAESTPWQVDLTKFGSGIVAYLATLSRNSHAQICYS